VPIASPGWAVTGEKYSSCGRVRPGYQVRIVDEHDEEVPPGTVGELIVRADEPWVMNVGYLNMPEATADAWRHGWFHTGDALMCDDDGDFYFVDRLKDAIRRRGENISSAEVEIEVSAFPAVAECAAVAVPSEWSEDEVKVFVIAKPDTNLDPVELIEFLRPRMAHYMIPRFVEIVDELPRTNTFKVMKHELRDRGNSDATWDREAAGIVVKREA
jgi:crotonobetaine/carnitine-CoA ligase